MCIHFQHDNYELYEKSVKERDDGTEITYSLVCNKCNETIDEIIIVIPTNKRRVKLSSLSEGQRFDWSFNQCFGGKYIKEDSEGIHIIEFGCDGNSPHYEIREDRYVYIED